MTEAPVCIVYGVCVCLCKLLFGISKIRKATFIEAMPFMTMFLELLGSHWTGVYEILY